MTTDVYVLPPPPVDASELPEWNQPAETVSTVWSTAGVGPRVASRLDNFTTSASAGADAWVLVQAITLAITRMREPTIAERAAAGLEAVAEFERQFGPIPDEVIADVQRRWPS
jgi:hypothetical protein